MDINYCRKACGGKRCDGCPEPAYLDEALPGIRAYLLCRTQWRVGMAGRTGLDYAGCQTVLAVHSDNGNGPFEPLNETWVQLQTIENALLDVDAERRAKDRPDGD